MLANCVQYCSSSSEMKLQRYLSLAHRNYCIQCRLGAVEDCAIQLDETQPRHFRLQFLLNWSLSVKVLGHNYNSAVHLCLGHLLQFHVQAQDTLLASLKHFSPERILIFHIQGCWKSSSLQQTSLLPFSNGLGVDGSCLCLWQWCKGCNCSSINISQLYC